MATLSEQVTNIQSVNWSDYPAVKSVNIFTYEPQVTIRNGVAINQSFTQYTVTVALNGGEAPNLMTKYVMITSLDSLSTTTSLMHNAGTLLTDMVAGTSTDQQHAVVDRGNVINFQGKQIQ